MQIATKQQVGRGHLCLLVRLNPAAAAASSSSPWHRERYRRPSRRRSPYCIALTSPYYAISANRTPQTTFTILCGPFGSTKVATRALPPLKATSTAASMRRAASDKRTSP